MRLIINIYHMSLSVFILLFIFFTGCHTYDYKLLGEAKRSAELSKWRYLDDFVVDISLPALYSPATNQFQNHCLLNKDEIDTLDPDLHVHEKYLDMKLIANKLKKDLSLLIKEPDLHLSRTKKPQQSRLDFIKQWHVFLFGLKYLRVNKDSLDLSFQHDECVFEDFTWYEGGREIITSAMFIDSILFILDGNHLGGDNFYLDSSFTSGPLKNESGLTFTLHKSPKGYYKIVVRSIYYAVRTISLKAHEFNYSYDTVEVWKHYPFSNNSFMVKKIDSNESFCYFRIYTPEEKSLTYCAIVGIPRVFTIKSDYIGTFKPVYMDYGYKVNITLAKIAGTVDPKIDNTDEKKMEK